MRPDQLDEFLEGTTFRKSEKADIRQAAKKTEAYLAVRFWHRLNHVRKAVADTHNYVERNSVFMPRTLRAILRKPRTSYGRS